MKFSDVDQEQWPQLKPYLDTVLLPVTGLIGSEEPWEATHKLERLRDLIDAVDGPFRGRVVVYPAHHYITDYTIEETIQSIGVQLRAIGFVYLVIVIRGEVKIVDKNSTWDLVLSDSLYAGKTVKEMNKDVYNQITRMWSATRLETNM